MNGKNLIRTGLIILTFILFAVALYMVFIFVPTERTMGVVQRIFYFHVPLAWLGLLAYMIVFISSILYLWKRKVHWDALAVSAAELGFIFTTLFLISGSLWAKPAWGVWWTWSPRLTTALILWFIYIAYLTVRSYASEANRGARFSAVVAIVGFADIPLVILATTLWQSEHPGALVFEGGLTPEMNATLMTCIAAFTFLFVWLIMLRFQIKTSEIEISNLKEVVVNK